MCRRKYASNIYAGLLKSLREVQFDRSDLQPPILNEVDDLDEDTESEEDDSFEEKLPLDLEIGGPQKFDEQEEEGNVEFLMNSEDLPSALSSADSDLDEMSVDNASETLSESSCASNEQDPIAVAHSGEYRMFFITYTAYCLDYTLMDFEEFVENAFPANKIYNKMRWIFKGLDNDDKPVKVNLCNDFGVAKSQQILCNSDAVYTGITKSIAMKDHVKQRLYFATDFSDKVNFAGALSFENSQHFRKRICMKRMHNEARFWILPLLLKSRTFSLP
ncbi:hypothetical protein BD560DRAFT_441849 [Blakeslea trispora]|nr:hypothetical protein BD560DRAFT_441849 [Blakeslea trispora]